MILVAGGLDNNYYHLSSTEVLTTDSPVWSMATPLPRAVYGVRGVTVGDTVYMTGILYCACYLCLQVCYRWP